MMPVIRLTGTLMSRDNAAALMPRAFKLIGQVLARMNRRACHMFASSVIVGDLDVVRPVRALGPLEADPPLVPLCALGAWPARALDLLKIESALPYKLAQSSGHLFA
jgi:hypothetical protein